jgi:hypothetical protein
MPQLPQTEHGTNGGSNLTGSPIRKEKKSFATQSPHKQTSTDATGMFSRVGIQMWKGSAPQSSQRAAAPEISVPIPCSLKNFP